MTICQRVYMRTVMQQCPETEEKQGTENKPCFQNICNMEIPEVALCVIKLLLKEQEKK